MKIPATKAGVQIDAIWCDRAEFEDVGFDVAMKKGREAVAGDIGEMDYKSHLEVWYKKTASNTERGEALVRLTVELAPELQPTYKIRTAIVGQFSAEPDSKIPLPVFATEYAITYLIPFLREKIVQLTASSRYDAYLLPPIDVSDMIKGIVAARKVEEVTPDAAETIESADSEPQVAPRR